MTTHVREAKTKDLHDSNKRYGQLKDGDIWIKTLDAALFVTVVGGAVYFSGGAAALFTIP